MFETLNAVQLKFADGLLDASQIDQAIHLFKGDRDVNRERFALYRGNVYGIWEQTCAAAYPVLRQLVGAAFFADLTRGYGHVYPSQSGDLNKFGANLADYIASLDLCEPFPYLPEVARLEWLVHRAYYLAHTLPATIAQLAEVAPERLGLLKFGFQPCCALIQSDWAIGDIWQRHQSDFPAMPSQLQELKRPDYCLVWRQAGDWMVHVASITASQYAALRAARAGTALGEMLDLALKTDPQFDLQSALADWFQKQLIISISTEHT